jgi:hypothetical protein
MPHCVHCHRTSIVISPLYNRPRFVLCATNMPDLRVWRARIGAGNLAGRISYGCGHVRRRAFEERGAAARLSEFLRSGRTNSFSATFARLPRPYSVEAPMVREAFFQENWFFGSQFEATAFGDIRGDGPWRMN